MRVWISLVVLLAALGGAKYWIDSVETDRGCCELDGPHEHHDHHHSAKKEKNMRSPKATLEPGRVVQLDTARGQIDIVLFEKDVPKTTKRIAELVNAKRYDGVRFTRVENWVIQVEKAKGKDVPGMPLELVEGIVNAKGAVGMARTTDPNSNSSQFYILLEPSPGLDMQYTVFGRVIRGIDVALNIKKNDPIVRAKLRPLTDEDKRLLGKALAIETERRYDTGD